MAENSDIDMIRRYIAETSVGASTVRGYAKKTQMNCRTFLYNLDLKVLAKKDEQRLHSWLNKQTEKLKSTLRRQGRRNKGAETYGIARKVINIFLHNVYYNGILCDEYAMAHLGDALEVPIDSDVRKWLFCIAQNTRPQLCIDRLIRNADRIWKIGEDENTAYQVLARQVARQLGTKRVYLDAYFYRGEHSLYIWEDTV